ncbi:MAG: hypothetical protein QOF14_4054 [Hyphomicrobiales bacterium]|nr:hypothetical protein [Hyphomicrobiales bacterium]
MKRHRLQLAACAIVCAGAILSTPQAQSYPTKPVMITVGASAGTGPDVVARIVADRLTQAWGRQVTVVNRTGGLGLTAVQSVTAAPADGHTLLVSLASTFVVLPETPQGHSVNLERAIVPVGLLGIQPMVIAINPSVGANSLAELLAMTKQRPGEILYGGFRATVPHLAGLLLTNRAGMGWRFIPSLSPRAVQDAMGGTIHVAIESVAGLNAPIKAGLLNGLAVASESRLPDFPDLPTVAEAIPGLGAFDARGWIALLARAETPPAIIQKISEDLRTVLADPDVVSKLASLGTYPRPMSPEETAAFIRSEQDLWRPVVKQLDLASQ